MSKLSFAKLHIPTALLTMFALVVLAGWILKPLEWRASLLHLLSRSFSAFAGNDRSGWLLSHVYAPTFVILVTVVLVGILRGGSAMRRHIAEKSSLAFLSLLSLLLIFYGFIFLRAVVRSVYEDHKLLVSENLQLAEEKMHLANNLNSWETRSLVAQRGRKSSPTFRQESIQRVQTDAQERANEILEFQEERGRNRPVILIGGAAELSRKTMEDSDRYNRQAVIDFLKTFGGPIESIVRRSKPYGVDTSRLQRHIAELNSIAMMRLIADDLGDVAGQLDSGNRHFLKTAARADCPAFYSSCP